MEEFKETLAEFKIYLSKITSQMTNDLKTILSKGNIVYKEGKSDDDTAGYFFEYDYELLTVVFWGVDKGINPITETVTLPSQFIEESHPTALISEEMHEFEMEIEDEYDNEEYSEEEFDELFEKYHEDKCEIFENWFCDCWKEASSGIKNDTDSYFSVHDTNYKTDLKTLNEITLDEIEQRYK